MTEEKKQQIVDMAQEQSKNDKSYGTMLLNHRGQLDNTVKKDRAIPMDAFAQKTLAKLVNDPTANLNMIYAGPAAITATGSFKGKTEADIAKAFQGKSLSIELPESYSTNPEYKKVYDKLVYLQNQRYSHLNKEFHRKRDGNDAPDDITKIMQITEIPSSDKEDFEKYWSKIPKGMTSSGLVAAIADFKVGKKGNYQNKKTILTSVPITTGSTVNPLVKDQLGFTKFESGTGANKETGYRVFIEYDATGVTMKNKTDPHLQKTQRDWYQASYNNLLIKNNVITAEDSKENIKAKIKPKTGNK
jgi:hypothetical protein